MMGNIEKVGSALKRCLTIWVAAISLLGFAPRGDLRARRQAAGGRQGAGAMEVSPRGSQDRRYPPRDQIAADHLRESGASLPQPNPLLRRHVRRAREPQ